MRKIVSKMMWRLCVLRLPRERQPRTQRRPRAPQLVQEALCTAPATPKAAAAPAAATRAAARPGGSVYCACHAKSSRGPQRRPRAPQLLQEALCIAPATRKAAAAPAAATRAAARPGGSVYCACHAKGSRGPSGGHAHRSSSRRLCVLRLPRQRQPRPQRRPRAPQLVQEALCTAPATPKAAAAPAAATRAAARLGGSVYCACHAKGSRGTSGGHARRSSSRRLCVLPERQPRPQRRPRAPQLRQEALCSAFATQKASSLYCACLSE